MRSEHLSHTELVRHTGQTASTARYTSDADQGEPGDDELGDDSGTAPALRVLRWSGRVWYSWSGRLWYSIPVWPLECEDGFVEEPAYGQGTLAALTAGCATSLTAALCAVLVRLLLPSYAGVSVVLAACAIAVLGALLLTVFTLDPEGALTLNGTREWEDATTGERLARVAGYMLLPELLLPLYLAGMWHVQASAEDAYVMLPSPQLASRETTPRGGRWGTRALQVAVALGLVAVYLFSAVALAQQVPSAWSTLTAPDITASYAGTATATPAIPAPTPTINAADAAHWTTVKHFGGSNSNVITAQFAVPAGWRIVWQCQRTTPAGGNFVVQVYTSGARFVNLAANAIGDSSGVTPVASGGTYYLQVLGIREQWSIDVQRPR